MSCEIEYKSTKRSGWEVGLKGIEIFQKVVHFKLPRSKRNTGSTPVVPI